MVSKEWVHIGDITNEKRLDHPRKKLAKDQLVSAVVLELDRERRRIRWA
jgi:ribosomal protein S1